MLSKRLGSAGSVGMGGVGMVSMGCRWRWNRDPAAEEPLVESWRPSQQGGAHHQSLLQSWVWRLWYPMVGTTTPGSCSGVSISRSDAEFGPHQTPISSSWVAPSIIPVAGAPARAGGCPPRTAPAGHGGAAHSECI